MKTKKNNYYVYAILDPTENGIFKYGWYDNIFTTIGSCEYYTYGNEVVDYSSDHKPIYAIIKI